MILLETLGMPFSHAELDHQVKLKAKGYADKKIQQEKSRLSSFSQATSSVLNKLIAINRFQLLYIFP